MCSIPTIADRLRDAAGQPGASSLLQRDRAEDLALYPSPNGSYLNGTANYFNVATTTNNWNQFSGRIDYSISGKDTVFGRYTGNYQTATAPGMTSYNEQIFPSSQRIWPLDGRTSFLLAWSTMFGMAGVTLQLASSVPMVSILPLPIHWD